MSGESVLKSRTGVFFGSSLCCGYWTMSARMTSPPARLRSRSSTSVTTRALPERPIAPATVSGTAPGAGAGAAASPVTVGNSADSPSWGVAPAARGACSAGAAGVSRTAVP